MCGPRFAYRTVGRLFRCVKSQLCGNGVQVITVKSRNIVSTSVCMTMKDHTIYEVEVGNSGDAESGRLMNDKTTNCLTRDVDTCVYNLPVEPSSYMVVGLGNPAPYTKTRHNLGMQYVDHLAAVFEIQWMKNKKCLSAIGESTDVIPGIHLILVKPMVFMNESGKSVSKAAKHFNVPITNICVVHDNLQRPLGKFNIKEGGSANGHNGVKSVISYLKSDNFSRLCIGIGRPLNRADVVDYVLSVLTKTERNVFCDLTPAMTDRVINHIRTSTHKLKQSSPG